MAKSAQPQPIKESCRGRACGPVSLVPRMTVKERCWISVSSQLFTQMEALSWGDREFPTRFEQISNPCFEPEILSEEACIPKSFL